MKHLLPILLIGLSIASCKKEDNEINTTPNIIDSEGISYIDNVSIVEPEYQFPFETYYTKLDTSVNVRSYTLPIHVLVTEGDSAQVTWNTNGLTPIIFSYSKKWEATLQKWKVTSALMFEPSSTLGMRKIDRTVRFVKSGQSITKSTNINLTKAIKTFDFGRVNFGMSKDEVKTNIMAIVGNDNALAFWEEFSPTHCFINSAYFITQFRPPVSCYEFIDKKLNRIYEIFAMDNYRIDYLSSDLLKKLGNNNILREGNIIKVPQSWEKNGIKMVLDQKEFQRKSGKFVSLYISFEKK
ncbi:hypothetical protein [Siphonobacter curvatus]|uniref:Uncharacterized protein n=1 Tax=Siphonobacter curvatus TaxID=2094562 RepID=A0A2S7IR85_9BACT|nr:hypothetical protein [Siphonobacter curvatus]PQA60148.1 hypothetical protein C5O19_11175 [Siphonobacter curvatus]